MTESVATEDNVSSESPHARPAGGESAFPSICCNAPRRVWQHFVQLEGADYEARKQSRVVCSACKGPADGSRVEDDDEMPWRVLRGDDDGIGNIRVVRRGA